MGLAESRFDKLLEGIRSRTPTPGGGAVAALVGALGTALGEMTLAFSRSDKTPEDVAAVVESLTISIRRVSEQLAGLADEDAAAYEEVRRARKLPRESEAQISERAAVLAEALRAASEVPLRIARLCRDGLEMLDGIKTRLTPHLVTDAVGAGQLLATAARLALWNVRVNLRDLDAAEAKAPGEECRRLDRRLGEVEAHLREWAEEALGCSDSDP